MRLIRWWLWWGWGWGLWLASDGYAVVRFHSTKLPETQPKWADFNGDTRLDAWHIEDNHVLIYLQHPTQGFGSKPDHQVALPQQPTLLWTARLGQSGECVLAMTHEGVCAWHCHQDVISHQSIITQATAVPRQTQDPTIRLMPLSLQCNKDNSLILIPIGPDLQVWTLHEGRWQCRQTLSNALRLEISGHFIEMGYDHALTLNLNTGDLNGDGRDDLITCQTWQQENHFRVYLQDEQGYLQIMPDLDRTTPYDWGEHTWVNWIDMNQDHHVDLLHTTWLRERWFLPGTRSGKVLVRVFLNDGTDHLPAEPSTILRKNDWLSEVPVVDVDGDGTLDLILGHSLFDTREGMRKSMMAKQLDFNFTVHCFDPDQGFRQDADCQRNLVMRLNNHSMHLTDSRRWKFERYVNFTGDFDGDGDIDLLVRDHDKKISAYPFLSRKQGFGRKAIVRFNYVESVERFEVRDLNADGVSDLISKAPRQNHLKIFLSQRQ